MKLEIVTEEVSFVQHENRIIEFFYSGTLWSRSRYHVIKLFIGDDGIEHIQLSSNTKSSSGRFQILFHTVRIISSVCTSTDELIFHLTDEQFREHYDVDSLLILSPIHSDVIIFIPEIENFCDTYLGT